MNLTWADTIPAVLAAVAILFIPGFSVALLVAGRRAVLLAVSAAVPVSVGWMGATAVAFQIVGVPFSAKTYLPFLAVTLTLCAAQALRRRRSGTFPPAEDGAAGRSPVLWLLLAWASSGGFLMWRILTMVGAPGNIAQLHDNAFHLNAVRYVIDSGQGSSLTLGRLGVDGSFGYYPAAWHDAVAVVSTASSTALVPAVTATTALLVALAWPAGCMLVTTRLLGTTPLGLAVGAVLSVCFSTYPYTFYSFAAPYPWMTATAFAPTAVGLTIVATGLTDRRDPLRRSSALLLLLVAIGIAAAHPSVLTALLFLVTPLVVIAVRTGVLIPGTTTRRGRLVVGLAYGCVVVAAWIFLRPPRVPNWDNTGDPALALAGGMLMAPVGGPVPWVLVGLLLLAMLGLIVAPALRWTMWMFLAWLIVQVASQLQPLPDLRWWLAGVWYSDPYRAASLLPVAAVALFATPFATVGSLVSTRFSLARPSVRIVGAGIACAGIYLAQHPVVSYAVEQGRDSHRYRSQARLLSPAEVRLIERLPSIVPVEATIAADPMTGAALSYALGERAVISPFPGVVQAPDGALILRQLDEMSTAPEVCIAVARLSVGYVLDFAGPTIEGLEPRAPTGLDDLTPERGFQLIDKEGPAKLYKIRGCSVLPASAG